MGVVVTVCSSGLGVVMRFLQESNALNNASARLGTRYQAIEATDASSAHLNMTRDMDVMIGDMHTCA